MTIVFVHEYILGAHPTISSFGPFLSGMNVRIPTLTVILAQSSIGQVGLIAAARGALRDHPLCAVKANAHARRSRHCMRRFLPVAMIQAVGR